MNNVYIFLDYSNTTNELINNGELNKNLFDMFFNSIIELENICKIQTKLIITTGNNQASAEKILLNLDKGFSEKKRRDILEGIAFEYGGYFLTKEKKVFQLCFSRNNDSDTKNIISLSKEYGCSPINGYKSVLSFEMQNPTQNHINFIKNVKKVVKNSKLVEFNDKYGCGIDIVPKEFSKANFVENFLKDKTLFDFIIVGGDGEEDLNMLNTSFKSKTYFVGFYNCKVAGKNIFLSNKVNIEGITEALHALSNSLIKQQKKDQ